MSRSGHLEFVGYGFAEDLGERWVQWTPQREQLEPALAESVRTFESIGNPAGERCAEWLREEALDNHPSTVTHLLVLDDEVHAFFAMCSGHAKFSQRDRRRLIGDVRAHGFTPVQPVAHVAWLAKRRHTHVRGLDILARAAAVALEVIDAGQGQIALTLNAFDELTAKMWRERYRLRRSQPLDGRVHLWQLLLLPD